MAEDQPTTEPPATDKVPTSELPRMSADELRSSGYLAAANQQFFHPLGLALAVFEGTSMAVVLDDRGDSEGWVMSNVDADLVAKVDNVAALARDRYPSRVAALGFWIQPLGTSTGPDPAPALPEVFEDEGGDEWWAKGHVDPASMVLAVAVTLGSYGEPEDTFGWLTGDVGHVPLSTHREHVALRLQSVQHVWLHPTGPDEERWIGCDPTAEGAEPFTMVAL